MTLQHPARVLPFDDLCAGLYAAKAEGLVTESIGANGLRLFCYSKRAVYDRVWTPFTLMARGLVLDLERRVVVATPFPKFFNAGEGDGHIPDLPFETLEKVDGSLVIIFHHAGRWQTATKGSLTSSQAAWAADQIAHVDQSELVPGISYLAEAVYPENRIVVHYEESGLVLLGAYDEHGFDLPYGDIVEIARRMGWRAAKRHAYTSFSDLIARSATLPANEEGFVVRFANGYRLKVKGDEYRRIHALISRCTPLAMWESLLSGDDMAAIRRDLPEEFWADFDSIVGLLERQIARIEAATRCEADRLAGASDKEVGLQLASLPAEVRPFIFQIRKTGSISDGKTRVTLFRAIRPTGNVLPGYTPSYAMNLVMDEAA